MGSAANQINFNGNYYSNLTGAVVKLDPIHKNPNIPSVSGKIEDWVIYLNDDAITNKRGEIDYVFNGIAKKTHVSLGCTLSWLIRDDEEHFHPQVYSDLFSFIKI